MVEGNDWRKGGLVSSRYPARMYVCETTITPHSVLCCYTQSESQVTFYVNLFMADTPEVVQYSYRAEKDNEIDLVIGDVVLVRKKSEDGQCKGVIGDREGWFPENCARKCTYDCCTVVTHSDLCSVLSL